MELQEHLITDLKALPAAVGVLRAYAGERRIFCFKGQLGAGKTTFIKAFCAALGVRESVTSPTYSLVNEYRYTDGDGNTGRVFHMDLYRLRQPEEARDFGLEDYLESGEIVLIEWYEIVEDELPEDAVFIKIQIEPDSTRKMIFL